MRNVCFPLSFGVLFVVGNIFYFLYKYCTSICTVELLYGAERIRLRQRKKKKKTEDGKIGKVAQKKNRKMPVACPASFPSASGSFRFFIYLYKWILFSRPSRSTRAFHL